MRGLYLIFNSLQQPYPHHLEGVPRDVKDGDFRSQHPYAAAALAVTLIGVGSAIVLPAVAVGILGAIGFCPGGVAAGQYFLCPFSRTSPSQTNTTTQEVLQRPSRQRCTGA